MLIDYLKRPVKTIPQKMILVNDNSPSIDFLAKNLLAVTNFRLYSTEIWYFILKFSFQSKIAVKNKL